MGWMISQLSSSENTKVSSNSPMMVVDESLKRKKTKINLEVAIRLFDSIVVVSSSCIYAVLLSEGVTKHA